MEIEFADCVYRNEWRYIGGHTEAFKDKIQDTVCFSALTIRKMNTTWQDFNCTFEMYFNTIKSYEYFDDRPFSNVSFFTLDQYREFIQLVQDYIPKFTWELKENPDESIEDVGNKHCIILKMENVNKSEFLFITTMVRYGYEIPSSPYMPQVLQLYHFLNEELDIVNCTNLVLGLNRATHFHETQCLYGYYHNGAPDFVKRKIVLNRLRRNIGLNYCFTDAPRRNTNIYPINTELTEYLDTDEWPKTIDKYFNYYLNYYNKWSRKSIL